VRRRPAEENRIRMMELQQAVSRRRWLTTMGATLGATALTAAALLVVARVLIADRQHARIIVAALVGVYFVAYAFWVAVAPRGMPREDE
jgi:hypothetical protein